MMMWVRMMISRVHPAVCMQTSKESYQLQHPQLPRKSKISLTNSFQKVYDPGQQHHPMKTINFSNNLQMNTQLSNVYDHLQQQPLKEYA
jgi:uncharacterized protein YpbB